MKRWDMEPRVAPARLRTPAPWVSVLLAACLALCLASCGGGARKSASAPGPAKLTPAEADTLLRAYAQDRKDTDDWLKSAPTSYLATVQRVDFNDQSSLTVGSAPGSDVRLQDPGVKPHHLRVTVAGDSFLVQAVDRGATFRFRDSTMTSATLPPSAIRIARFILRLSHQRYPALIVFDPESPRFQEYKGMRWYPPDLAFHYVLPLTPNPNPDTTIILSTRGNRRRAVRVGWFAFQVRDTLCRLEVDRLLEPGVGENDISLFFTDETTGKETYRVGRYLEPVPAPDGRYVLDFNMCYDPACAYSNYYNCPIPPAENHLKVAVTAGQMDAHYLH
jgi:uncharacterized protein (DUF1684 family)